LRYDGRKRKDGLVDWRERIIVDPKVLVGKPIIKGTRIAVEFITELLAEGWSHTQILSNYPQLKEDDIRAALAYATELMKEERVYRLPA
jgi:uncharacterized protein (DUF433 family)